MSINKGFTIWELLVVLTIIAILALVALPKYKNIEINNSMLRETIVLQRCNQSFGDNSPAYLSCVGQNLNVDEVEEVIKSDFSMATNQRNEFDKAIRTTTGVSINDIKEHGLMGGSNSEARKVMDYLFEQENIECLQLGISSKTRDCSAYENLIGGLKESSFFYNKPSKMIVGESTEIDLSINPFDSKEAKAEIKNLQGKVTEGRGKFSRHMSAELFGATFEISPSGPQKRVVVSPNTTTWKWKVKPIKKGDEELLTLDVFVHLEVDGKTSSPITIKTFREKILVEVTAWDAIKQSTSDWSPIITVFLAVVGALWGAYRWLRNKKWKAEDSTG